MPFYSYVSALGSNIPLEVGYYFSDSANNYTYFTTNDFTDDAQSSEWSTPTLLGIPYYFKSGSTNIACYPVILCRTTSSSTTKYFYTFYDSDTSSFPSIKRMYVSIKCSRKFGTTGTATTTYYGQASGWITPKSSGTSTLSITRDEGLLGVTIGGTITFTWSEYSQNGDTDYEFYREAKITANMTAGREAAGGVLILTPNGGTIITDCTIYGCAG